MPLNFWGTMLVIVLCAKTTVRTLGAGRDASEQPKGVWRDSRVKKAELRG